MTRLMLSIGLVGALAVSACSSNGSTPVDSGTGGSSGDGGVDAPSDGGVKVTVSGTAAPHPLTTPLGMNPATDFSMLTVAVADPLTVLTAPTAPALASGPLDTMPANCNGTSGCGWSFPNVDISGISIGIVGIIDDTRTPATSRLWIKTGTGAGSLAFIDSIRANPMPITDRRLFVVSKATEAKLAQFAAAFVPDTAIVAGSLEARGFMLGTVIGKLSAGVTPVAGATVAVPTSELRVNILYPNDTFTGVGTSTASSGTFLVVPKSATPGAIVTSWTVTPPATGPDSTLAWTATMAGSTPGTAFVILFPANE